MGRELERENQVLRDRVAQLERALSSGTDPLLRSLGEHAASYINVITPDGHFLATGRPSEGFGSVVGRSLFDFVDAPSAKTMRAVFARVAATGRPEAYESVGYGEDGSPGHSYLTRCVPLVEDNKVSCLLLVPTDITERVRLEQSLIEKEEALRFAIQASRLGLWSWEVASGVITWNDRMRAIWGTDRTPSSFQAYMEHVHPEDRAMVEGEITRALATGEYPTFEHRGLAFDGRREFWVLAAGTVIKDGQGKPIRLMGGTLDITDQKQLATQKQRAARVEGIGQLAAGIAHNFNNLLAVIVPNIELELSANPAVRSAGLTAALDAALQARDLVRNLLLLTQRDPAGPPTPSDPLEVVTRVVGICRVTFPREISLRHQVAPPLGFVSMPAADLEQVLLNLLLNARDAVEAAPGGTREIGIAVGLIVTDEGTPMVQLRVKDSGIGMSVEVRARLFEPFFTTKPPHKGSGLGLANVAERVRNAGGTLQCESIPGQGTTFTVLLPVREAPRIEAKAPSVPAASAPSNQVVLLVDDEPLVRRTVRRLLERDGYSVQEAANAQEARQALQRSRVDLVILDQSMPGEAGIHAFPSLRALTEAPIVLFTGMVPAVPAGFAAILEKPARPEDLRRLVADTLGPKRAAPP